jgi:hypothetical protein
MHLTSAGATYRLTLVAPFWPIPTWLLLYYLHQSLKGRITDSAKQASNLEYHSLKLISKVLFSFYFNVVIIHFVHYKWPTNDCPEKSHADIPSDLMDSTTVLALSKHRFKLSKSPMPTSEMNGHYTSAASTTESL